MKVEDFEKNEGLIDRPKPLMLTDYFSNILKRIGMDDITGRLSKSALKVSQVMVNFWNILQVK